MRRGWSIFARTLVLLQDDRRSIRTANKYEKKAWLCLAVCSKDGKSIGFLLDEKTCSRSEGEEGEDEGCLDWFDRPSVLRIVDNFRQLAEICLIII